MNLSIVIPIYNEVENVPLLYRGLVDVLDPLPRTFEIVFINDGSRDGSSEKLDELAAADPRVKVVHLRRNFGQTAAMDAGLHHATGDIIVSLDGDLQNDPTDIPMMVAKLEEGYDLVHGWRKHRQDTFINRKLPSKIANWLISRVTRVPVHDLGCSLKAMRREIAEELHLQGDMHRFITILAYARGARCAEVETRHHPRRFGTTKYGIARTFRVILDLLTVKFMLDYSSSPMRLFGSIGGVSMLIGTLCGFVTLGMKLFQQVDMTGNPLLLATVFCLLGGMQFLTLGLLGEIGVRTFFASQGLQHYGIRRLVNFDPETVAAPSLSRHARAA